MEIFPLEKEEYRNLVLYRLKGRLSNSQEKQHIFALSQEWERGMHNFSEPWELPLQGKELKYYEEWKKDIAVFFLWEVFLNKTDYFNPKYNEFPYYTDEAIFKRITFLDPDSDKKFIKITLEDSDIGNYSRNEYNSIVFERIKESGLEEYIEFGITENK